MSCDWNIYCQDCDDELSFSDANHAEPLMHWLIVHAAAIAALEPCIKGAPEEITFRVYYGEIFPSWFARHLGHRLIPRDEYGAIAGQCAETVRCACGASHRCKKSLGHKDPHA